MDLGGPSYALRTADYEYLEVSIEECFALFKGGHKGVIKVGMMHYGLKNFFIDFDRRSVVEMGLATPTPDGMPFSHRIYIDVKAQTEHQIADNTLIAPLGHTDQQVIAQGGDVIYDTPVAIKLHLCPKGMFLHFDPRRDPDSCLTLKLGSSLSRHNTEAIGEFGMMVSQERKETELYIRRCISYAKSMDKDAIKVGRGEWKNYKIFMDFMMPQYEREDAATVGNTPQAYRIFVDVDRSEEHQMGGVIKERMCNANFVAGFNGMIYGPEIAKVRLHACTEGVSIHFDPAIPPGHPLTFDVGAATPRVNQFSDRF